MSQERTGSTSVRPGDILALDVGEARIGVARASNLVRLPEPLGAILNDDTVWEQLRQLCHEHEVSQLVVGLPRNLSGDDTPQTSYARNFAAELAIHLGLPVALQDEALTSKKAEAELQLRRKPYSKADIDALAATYILSDYLNDEHGTL